MTMFRTKWFERKVATRLRVVLTNHVDVPSEVRINGDRINGLFHLSMGYIRLVGGFQIFFNVHPETWEKNPILTSLYVSKGFFVQPPHLGYFTSKWEVFFRMSSGDISPTDPRKNL